MSARGSAPSSPQHLQCLQSSILVHTRPKKAQKDVNMTQFARLNSIMPSIRSKPAILCVKSAKDLTSTYLLRQQELGSENVKLSDLLPIEGPGRPQQDLDENTFFLHRFLMIYYAMIIPSIANPTRRRLKNSIFLLNHILYNIILLLGKELEDIRSLG